MVFYVKTSRSTYSGLVSVFLVTVILKTKHTYCSLFLASEILLCHFSTWTLVPVCVKYESGVIADTFECYFWTWLKLILLSSSTEITFLYWRKGDLWTVGSQKARAVNRSKNVQRIGVHAVNEMDKGRISPEGGELWVCFFCSKSKLPALKLQPFLVLFLEYRFHIQLQMCALNSALFPVFCLMYIPLHFTFFFFLLMYVFFYSSVEESFFKFTEYFIQKCCVYCQLGRQAMQKHRAASFYISVLFSQTVTQ